jgi:hypothetical protein
MKANTTAIETLEYKGITYEVCDRTTPETAEAQGWPNLAKNMLRTGQVAQLTLRRINGKKLYGAILYKSGYVFLKPC